jgi:hypothetical protein
LDCWFVTDFGDTIRVTLRVELFAFLRELAMTLKGKLASVFDNAGGAISGGGGSGSSASPGGSGSSGGSVVGGKAANKALLVPKKNVMRIQAFSLEPRVNVLENLTPYAVGKVFELLKIGDPQQMIPEAVHEGLTVNAEKLLFAVKEIFMRIDELYVPKEKTVTAVSATKSAPRIFVTSSTPQPVRAMPGATSAKNTSSAVESPSKASCTFLEVFYFF